VRNPLTFFALALLVVESTWGSVLVSAGLTPDQKLHVIDRMALLFALVIVVVAAITFFRPSHLFQATARARDEAAQPASSGSTIGPGPSPETKAALEEQHLRVVLAARELDSELAIDQAQQSLMPGVFMAAREKAKQAQCMSNLKQLALATLMYAQDNDEALPVAEHWEEALRPYFRGDGRVLHCPVADGKGGYAMNANLSGVRLARVAEPYRTVMFFDSDSDLGCANDGGTSLPNPGRHLERNVVAFVDGHAEAVSEQEQRALKWDPA
jgi:prepilin-type processing-associated H-X9-DG protein